MRVRCKVWIETDDGKPIMSEGKYRLLKEIGNLNSIKLASEKLGLTYKRAHSQIKTLEKRLGKKVIKAQRGKGAFLTEEGKKLISIYEELLKKFQEFCNVDLNNM